MGDPLFTDGVDWSDVGVMGIKVVAVFAFLPWCQLNRGHVTVDIFVNGFSARARAALTLVGHFALFAAATVIAWRLWLGMQDKLSYGEETYELGLPLGLGFAAAMVGAAFFALTALYTVWRSVNEVARGHEGVGLGTPR